MNCGVMCLHACIVRVSAANAMRESVRIGYKSGANPRLVPVSNPYPILIIVLLTNAACVVSLRWAMSFIVLVTRVAAP